MYSDWMKEIKLEVTEEDIIKYERQKQSKKVNRLKLLRIGVVRNMIIIIIILGVFLMLNIYLTLRISIVQNKYNEAFVEYICNIYDIIQFNGLVKECKKNEKTK